MCQATDKLLTSVKKYSIFPEMRNLDKDFLLKSTQIIEAGSYYNEAFCALKVWF